MTDYNKAKSEKSKEKIERDRMDDYYERLHREEEKQSIKKAVIYQHGEWDDDWIW